MTSPFEFPSSVTVAPPAVPQLVMAPPPAPQAIVMPIVGPPGPQGPPGDNSTALQYQTSVINQAVVTVNHNLDFYPAGIVCMDNNGTLTQYGAVSYPSVGTLILTFGFLFTGDIFLS
jgi:hypothetical protein